MSYLDMVNDLYALMAQGNTTQAFEKYYHENVVVIEPTGERREGKGAQRQAIADWFADLEEVHGGGVEAATSDEEAGVTIVLSTTDMTSKTMGRMTLREVAVQRWEGDQIIEEEFFYWMPAEAQLAMREMMGNDE